MSNKLQEDRPLVGKIALVAGGTRGAGRGIAVELGAAGATVYVTGRSTRTHASDYGRPETIEETAELVNEAGGEGIAVQVDHLNPAQVEALIGRVEAEHGRLDVLVNDIGGEHLVRKDIPFWEYPLEQGLKLLDVDLRTHLITSRLALPLLLKKPGGLVVEITDGTAEFNAAHHQMSVFFDLAKTALVRFAWTLGDEVAPHGATVVALTAGWLRSELMLDQFGVTEENWRDAMATEPLFALSETPRYEGRAVAALAADPQVSCWNRQSLSTGQLARIYGFTDVDGSRPDVWRYLMDVEAGHSVRLEDYR